MQLEAEKATVLAWPPFIGQLSLREAVNGLAVSQHWSAEEIADGQRAQLRQLLSWSATHVAHYRDAGWAARALDEMDRSPDAFWEIWRKLPILTKAALHDAGAGLRASSVPPGHAPLARALTSGSTGISVEVATTAATRLMWDALTLREMLWSGRNFGKRLGAIRYLDKADRSPKGFRTPAWPRLVSQFYETGPFGIIHVGHPVDVLAEWLREFDPHYLITHPTVADGLLDELGASGKPQSLEEILSVAEPLTEALEHRLSEQWRVRCSEYYSANEAGYIAFRCPSHSKLHVQSESVLVEIIDADGNACQPGESGRVVVTPLHNLASPLIRYELGDYASVGARCACGRPSPVIDRILGRVRNLARTADGRRFWPVDLGLLRTIDAIRQFQYVQSSPDTVRLRVVLARPLSREEEERAKLAAQRALGHPFTVSIEPVPAIERGAGGKFEEFLSLIGDD